MRNQSDMTFFLDGMNTKEKKELLGLFDHKKVIPLPLWMDHLIAYKDDSLSTVAQVDIDYVNRYAKMTLSPNFFRKKTIKDKIQVLNHEIFHLYIDPIYSSFSTTAGPLLKKKEFKVLKDVLFDADEGVTIELTRMISLFTSSLS